MADINDAEILVTLNRSLEKARAAIVTKTNGLEDAELRKPILPSGWSLLGLVKHLAYVERWWFRSVMAGEDVAFPWTDEDEDADWRVEPDETTEAILALYADECARARVVVDAFDLTESVRRPEEVRSGVTADLAWVVVHMIEETARHAGHADVVRELLDGLTGDR
jgi:uncharacterized damage-inducible protein DinB